MKNAFIAKLLRAKALLATLAVLAVVAVAGTALALTGGITTLTGLVRICNFSDGGCPTGATATSDGDMLVEDALEVDGATDLDSTLAVAGAVTAASSLAVTGTTTLTGDVTMTGALNGAELRTDEVALSLADMTGLRAANKTLVAAQGANTIIVPVQVLFFLNYGSAQITESADDLELHYVDASGDIACTAFETTASWLVAAADSYGYYTCDVNIVAATASIVNKALTLDNNGDGEFGGGTGSTFTAWVTYYVIDVS